MLTANVFPSFSLGELLERSQYGLSISSDLNGHIPMFKMNNFNNGLMDPLGVDFVSITNEELKTYKLTYGDILFNRTNSIDLVGKTGIFTLKGDYVFASYLIRLEVNKRKADPFYLNYFLNSDSAKTKLRALATKGVSQANINPTQLKKLLRIPIPSLPEQQKIAQILSTWDKAIEKLEALIATKQKRKKALMQQLLTGKKRFAGFEGKWKGGKLGGLVGKIYGGGTPSRNIQEYWNGNIPWVTVKDLVSSKIHGAQEYINENGLKESATNIVPVGTVIIATRMAVGKAVVASCDVAINQDLKAILPSQNVCSEYLHYWFLLHYEQIEKMGTGSTVKGVQIESIKSLHMNIPAELNEQQKIAAVLTAADSEIETHQKQLAAMKEQKKGLMQQLLTGKKRVKVDDHV